MRILIISVILFYPEVQKGCFGDNRKESGYWCWYDAAGGRIYLRNRGKELPLAERWITEK
jgi:hypothetical protein